MRLAQSRRTTKCHIIEGEWEFSVQLGAHTLIKKGECVIWNVLYKGKHGIHTVIRLLFESRGLLTGVLPSNHV